MATRLIVAVLLLALLPACATRSGVRLDTGQGMPVEYKPPTWSKPVEVDAEAFEQALRQLARTEPLTLRSAQQGWLVRASYPSFDADTRWQRLMGQSFGGFCKPGQRRADCVSLLDDVLGLSPWDKLGVGLALSIDPLKESISLVAMTARNGSNGGIPASSDGPSARTIEALLKPGGRLIGVEGSSPQIRIVKGSLSEAQKLFDQLSAGGTPIQGTTYPGTLVRLPAGGTVGLRPVSTSGPPTIDVRVPGVGIREIKFIL